MDKPERDSCELIIMGRILGTHTGWDETGDEQATFYAFQPNEIATKNGLTTGDLTFDWNAGVFQYYGPGGEVNACYDAVSILAGIARKEELKAPVKS